MNHSNYPHATEMPGSLYAAERVVPLVKNLIGPVRSVVDLGGGNGGWLKAFQDEGAQEVLLIDCPQVESDLVIPKSCFIAVDLNRNFPSPRRFDLAICLECAEHLTASRAIPLVNWLTASAETILFSAAIPGQGGHGHINEQLPGYWTNLFGLHEYCRVDAIRPHIINDNAIPWWYRQNLYLYTNNPRIIRLALPDLVPPDFCLIHNEVLLKIYTPGFHAALLQLWHAFKTSMRRKIGG